ncbi:hypothetical protein FKW77_001344 [Venturia effusa]|uniref:Uncharacterized protein n=1 Tax=Venturia effusa TaxID=50376 RepID=A0A517L8L7_9PEZI|nr:hypothetical protein FKW77_001344 [Venturia effusa]
MHLLPVFSALLLTLTTPIIAIPQAKHDKPGPGDSGPNGVSRQFPILLPSLQSMYLESDAAARPRMLRMLWGVFDSKGWDEEGEQMFLRFGSRVGGRAEDLGRW